MYRTSSPDCLYQAYEEGPDLLFKLLNTPQLSLQKIASLVVQIDKLLLYGWRLSVWSKYPLAISRYAAYSATY